MEQSVLASNKSKNNGGKTPKWATALGCVVVIALFGVAVALAAVINGNSGSKPSSSSSSTSSNKPTAEEIQDKIEDECMVKATENVRDRSIKITTVAGLLDADTNQVGKNRNGDPMTLYRWYGEKDGKSIMFACYAAADSNGNVGVASVSMGLEPIYANSQYDFAE